MKRLLRPSLLVLGTVTALLGGGGILAYAGWHTTTDSATFTVRAVRIPRVPRPTVTLPVPATAEPESPDDTGLPVVVPRIGWRGVEVAGEPVHRYIVTRHAGRTAEVVCTVPATRALSCQDLTAPPAARLTYTVAAGLGDVWVGPDSTPSVTVSTPGAPLVRPDGVPPDGDVSPAPTVTVAPSVATSAATDAPSPPPTATPEAKVASPEPSVTAEPPTSTEPTVAPMDVAEPSSPPVEPLTSTGP